MNRIRKPFLHRIFLTCFFILFIVCNLLTLVFFHQIYRQKNKLAETENAGKARMMARILDDKFTEMEKISTQITSSYWLNKVSSVNDIINGDVDILERRTICQQFMMYNATLRIVESTALILPQREMVIDSVSFWDEARFYQSVGLNMEELEDSIETVLPENYSALTPIPLEDREGFLMLKQLGYMNPPSQILMFYVDNSLLENAVLKKLEQGLFSLQLVKEDLVIYTYQAEEGHSDDTFSIRIPSEIFNWSYDLTISVPNGSFFGERLVWILFLTAMIFLEAAVSYFGAGVLYKPLLFLQQKMEIDSSSDGENEFELIERKFLALDKEKKEYYNMTKAILFSNLLQGAFEEEEMIRGLERFGVHFGSGMYFLTAVLEYEETVDEEQKAYHYLELTEWAGKNQVMLCIMENNEHNQVLIFASEEGEKTLKEWAGKCEAFYKSALSFEGEYIQGEPYFGLQGIRKSYNAIRKKQVFETEEENAGYYYPIEVEIQLVNQIKLGKEEAAAGILREIREENEKRNLSSKETRMAAFLITETMLRAGMEMDASIPCAELRKRFQNTLLQGEGKECWEFLEESLQMICGLLYKCDGYTIKKGRKLVEYVDAHYCDINLSQQELADAFAMSRSMVSKLFKAAAKVNFIDYLHTLRVQKAKGLFEEGNWDIMDVAGKVGYENEITFKRAFVRIEGITPRKYVQKLDTEGMVRKMK